MPIYDRDTETMPRAELEQLQVERLQATLRRVYRNVAFYRQRFDEQRIDLARIRSIDALRQIPLTTRHDLHASYPYDMFAVPLRDIVRIHSTSGTTGRPIGVGYTHNDIGHWTTLIARVLTGVDISDRDFVQIAFTNLATGTFGFHYGAERVGASVIPASISDLHEQIRIMRDYKTTALLSSPTYALRIARALQEMEIRPQELNLRCALLGGEPWSEALRAKIEEDLQIVAYDNYGLSEIMGPGVSAECECKDGLHVNEDHFLVEVIDPVTLEPRAMGEQGELVFTTLTKEGFPLIRYRTGDLAHLMPEPCRCGRTLMRMSRVSGRCDDLLIVNGNKFFPGRIEEILLATEGLGSRAELILERDARGDHLQIRTEVEQGFPLLDEIKNLERLKRQVSSALAAVLGLEARIVLVEHGTLTRAAGKRKLIVTDHRTQ